MNRFCFVMPAKAGIQGYQNGALSDPSERGNGHPLSRV